MKVLSETQKVYRLYPVEGEPKDKRKFPALIAQLLVDKGVCQGYRAISRTECELLSTSLISVFKLREVITPKYKTAICESAGGNFFIKLWESGTLCKLYIKWIK